MTKKLPPVYPVHSAIFVEQIYDKSIDEIYIPNKDSSDELICGKVVRSGQGHITKLGMFQIFCQIDFKVIFREKVARRFTFENREYWLLNESDVYAIISQVSLTGDTDQDLFDPFSSNLPTLPEE